MEISRTGDTHEEGRKGRGGRPRDQLIDTSVIVATLAILDAQGYGGVSVEAVARIAGTSRPAIYRRWGGRAPLVLAAIGERLDVPAPPDTGCTLCDLGEGFLVFLAAYRTIRPDVLSALYADCASDSQLRDRYVATVIEPARSTVGRSLDRAFSRGDLRPHVDRELLLDMVGSLVLYRSMFNSQGIGEQEAERAIEILLQGAARDYSSLIAHMEKIRSEHFDDAGAHHIHSSPR
ncbi:TetR/AcrR family transcriptional regulator [Natronoglycomyces albus]|uniref:TetR/AcrR family transcriptional regulator n=1 Tax=Natronoglycomyces albus TaxID=2811108 RepID=A0A895XT62_9ACTN|nr:TetR/AcrR family transcriptional regulator [Natronoglycomyces albus]QSB05450.1 TetR/AcrR family transcriptional regulator [Natronoglycomyces albus]